MTKAWTPLETCSVPRGADVAPSQDGLDHTAQAAHRAAAPMARDSGMLGAIERRHPALVKTAFPGEVGNHGGQMRIAILSNWARKGHEPHPVADRAGQWIQAVGRRHVGDLRQIEVRLQRGIRVTDTGLGLKKAEEAVPQPPIVAARAGFFDFVDEDKRIGDSAGGDGEKRMAGFSRVPAPVGTGKYRAIGAGRVLTPNAQAKDLSKAAGKSGLAAAGIADKE